MDKLVMQNGFFGHTKGTKKVSAGLKNTKNKIAKKRPISGRIAQYFIFIMFLRQFTKESLIKMQLL